MRPEKDHLSAKIRGHDLTKITGWTIAELRGRWHQELRALPEPAITRPTRTYYTLPLNSERSSGELLYQVAGQVHALGGQLAALDPPVALVFALADLPHQPQDSTGPNAPALDRLMVLSQPAHTASDYNDPATAWKNRAHVLYAWDTKIQDTLASSSSRGVAAYQLGRGLAEAYWSLEPTVGDDDARSWASLLSAERCEHFKRLLIQLRPYFDPLTVPAITAGLTTWRAAVTSGSVRTQSDALHRLDRQVAIWKILLVDRASPASFDDARTAVTYAGQLGTIVRTCLRVAPV